MLGEKSDISMYIHSYTVGCSTTHMYMCTVCTSTFDAFEINGTMIYGWKMFYMYIALGIVNWLFRIIDMVVSIRGWEIVFA